MAESVGKQPGSDEWIQAKPIGAIRQNTIQSNCMNRIDQLTEDMLARVLQFKDDHPLPVAITRGATLYTEVASHLTTYTGLSGTQAFGTGGYRAGARQRQLLVQELRTVLVDMAATARGLEPQNPGISEQFRLGRSTDSHQNLLAKANAFLTAVEPAAVKQLFTDRAFPADFDVQLTAKMTALAAAVGRKASGLQDQRQGTVGMDVLRRRVTETMRELRALMTKYLRDADPELLPVWKAAARIYRGSQVAPAPASGSGGTDGSGGSETPVTQPA